MQTIAPEFAARKNRGEPGDDFDSRPACHNSVGNIMLSNIISSDNGHRQQKMNPSGMSFGVK